MKPGVISGIIVSVLVVVGAGLFVLSGNSENTITTQTAQQSDSSSASESQGPTPGQEASELAASGNGEDQLLKLDEVAQKSTEDECWTIIDGAVYDITEYIPRHPGGKKILLACGGDGSVLFNERQDEDGKQVGSGTPHSSRAAGQLADYRVGTLDTTAE